MKFPCFTILTFLVVVSPLFAQRDRDEEVEDYYQKWLNEDVVYIITPEERQVFEKLTMPEEKERFIEQFWHRRDPDSSTSINEFKEEHYRRLAYANDNFQSGLEGWKTDRGRIYIIHGPPTSKERYPTGGVYQRPIQEGGGFTSTYAWEVWYYKHIEGLGTGIEMEFVDPTGSGEYKLALHETEKDALLLVPGAGNTVFEDLGIETRAGRIRSSMAMRSLGLKGDSYGNPAANPFIKLERYMDLSRPPQIKFADLKSLVETRVHYDNLPFEFRYDVFRYSNEKALCPVTIEVKNQDLAIQEMSNGAERAVVRIYGRVENLTHQIVYEFEDLISTAIGNPKANSLYQRLIPLNPGRYKITLVLRETGSGNVGSAEALLVVPEPGETLYSSTLVLADRILPAADGEMPPDPFVTLSGLKIYPNISRAFPENDPIGLYLELYNLQIEQTSLRPDIDVVYELRSVDSEEVISSQNITSSAVAFWGNKATVAKVLRDLHLAPGQYVLSLLIKDRLSGQRFNPQVVFSLTDAEQ